MFRLDAPRPVRFCDGLSRRDFLHAGALAPLGLTLPAFLGARRATPRRSPKTRTSTASCSSSSAPRASSTPGTRSPTPRPRSARRSSRSTPTSPGIRITDVFPKTAKVADKFSLIRTVYHTASAVHDSGHQLMQTGRFFTGGVEHPHFGCALGYLKGGRGELPAHVLLPRPIGNTGGNMPHGQTAGYLGKTYDPFVLNAFPEDPKFKVPDLLPPDYVSAVRADRRQRLREAVDAAAKSFESSPAAKQLDDDFALAYKLMSSTAGPVGVRPGPGAGRDAGPLRPDAVRPIVPARPPADRGRRAVRDRQHVRDRLRRDHLGHPRLGPVHRHQADGPTGGAEFRPSLLGAAERSERARPAGIDGGDRGRRVRPDAEDQPGRRPGPPSRLLDDADRRRPDPGRPDRRRIGRAWRTPRRRGR